MASVPDRLNFTAAGHSVHAWSHKGCHSIPFGTDLQDLLVLRWIARIWSWMDVIDRAWIGLLIVRRG